MDATDAGVEFNLKTLLEEKKPLKVLTKDDEEKKMLEDQIGI